MLSGIEVAGGNDDHDTVVCAQETLHVVGTDGVHILINSSP